MSHSPTSGPVTLENLFPSPRQARRSGVHRRARRHSQVREVPASAAQQPVAQPAGSAPQDQAAPLDLFAQNDHAAVSRLDQALKSKRRTEEAYRRRPTSAAVPVASNDPKQLDAAMKALRQAQRQERDVRTGEGQPLPPAPRSFPWLSVSLVTTALSAAAAAAWFLL